MGVLKCIIDFVRTTALPDGEAVRPATTSHNLVLCITMMSKLLSQVGIAERKPAEYSSLPSLTERHTLGFPRIRMLGSFTRATGRSLDVVR